MCFRAVLHVLFQNVVYLSLSISWSIGTESQTSWGYLQVASVTPELINHKELLKLLMLHVKRVTQIPHGHSNYIFSYSTMW